MPLSAAGRISDTHFYRARLRISGDGYTPNWYPPIAYYDSPTDNLIDTGTTSWDAFVGLPPDVSVFDLATNPVDGGYCIQVIAWERTLWSVFNFPNDQAYHYPGHRHDTDAKGFIYDAP
jgi:hypothetical protein